ncbi:MAG: insulinase family protein, partial [Congregibacter sp.]|nr:insulinase family protein [Congregibacter sp.]
QEFDPARFERLRRDMVLGLQNTVARRPSSQLMDEMRRALSTGAYDEPVLIAALEALDVQGLEAYRESFWASARAEAMLYGNYAPSDLDAMSQTLDIVLGSGEGEPALGPEVIKIAAGESLELHTSIEHDDAVVAWYLQGAGQTWRDRALVALTAQITESGFFQQLRTEQQLGYIVSIFPWMQFDVPGLLMLVQSPSHSSAHVFGAMQEFLVGTLEDITPQQFERHRQALINAVLKPQENLGERAEFYWQAIAFREWRFDSPQQMAAAVSALSFEDWQASYRTLFLEQPRSLLTLSAGAKPDVPETDNVVYDDPEVLRAGREIFDIDLSPL